MKFLVVHPDHFTQRALEITLRDLHHTTVIAPDGLEAIDAALDAPPDGILLGTTLPGLGGLDVARALRALAPTRGIPILLITNDGADSETVRQAALPRVDWLQMPLDLAQVRERLVTLVERSRAVPTVTPGDPPRDDAPITDPLTGLYARQYMLHRLAYESARAARYSYALAVILIGIDSMPAITTQFGVGAADHMLSLVAGMVRRSVRMVDLVGRSGAAEFLVIAPHTDETGARAIAGRLYELVQKAAFNMGSATVQLQGCVGAAISPAANLADNLALFGRAEAALARARAENTEQIAIETLGSSPESAIPPASQRGAPNRTL